MIAGPTPPILNRVIPQRDPSIVAAAAGAAPSVGRKSAKLNIQNVESMLTNTLLLTKQFASQVEVMLLKYKQSASNSYRLSIGSDFLKAEGAFRAQLEIIATNTSKSNAVAGPSASVASPSTSSTSSHPPTAVVAPQPTIQAIAPSGSLQQQQPSTSLASANLGPAGSNANPNASIASIQGAATAVSAPAANRLPPPPPKEPTQQDLEDAENIRRCKLANQRLLDLRRMPTAAQTSAINTLFFRIAPNTTFGDTERFGNVDKQVRLMYYTLSCH